jgi:sugar O-acyltransferase (sialic acid O-acetyltransferase NeuD family)
MVIIGAKGLAKEVLEIFALRNQTNNLFFFDNLSTDVPDTLFGRFHVIRSFEELKNTFERINDFTFTLGLGNPKYRYALQKAVSQLGGVLTSAISPEARIGQFETKVGRGCTILSNAVITNGVTLGEGCLINPNCTISHDATLGDYVEVSPGASITGNCRVGSFSNLGTNSVILPKVSIGENVIVGAGAVVTRDVPSNKLLVGMPAVIKKDLEPIQFANG